MRGENSNQIAIMAFSKRHNNMILALVCISIFGEYVLRREAEFLSLQRANFLQDLT